MKAARTVLKKGNSSNVLFSILSSPHLILKLIIQWLECTAHNGFVIGSTPIELILYMCFFRYKKLFKILKL